MSEQKLYGDLVHQPTYIKRASGLVMPGSVEQAGEMVRQTPYFLVHHLGNLLTVGERLVAEGQQCSLIDAAYAYRNDLTSSESDFFSRLSLRYRAGKEYASITGIDHSYDQDVDGDLEAVLTIYDSFVQGLSEQGKIIVGINNSLDPFCTGFNLAAIGSHCHIGWMDTTRELSMPEPEHQSDLYRLLAPVRWHVFAQLSERNADLEESKSFLRDINEGRIQIFLEQTQVMGTEIEVPEVHIDLDVYGTLTGYERFIYEQYLFKPTGLTNALAFRRSLHPDAYELAADIEQNVTLNNFQQYIAEHSNY